MSKPIVVTVDKVGKVFKIPKERHTTLKQHTINILRNKGYQRFRAIEEVSFEIRQGEFFGIIGQNGSGKSTLLKILAGIYTPTTGKISINGHLSPFIELGVGFNPELTARENIFLNGAILGLSRSEIDEQFDEIIEFAELEQFVDQKLKNFSSGMLVRLAFSVAIRAHAEILLIDEVLAVGDSNFQQKCFDVFRRLKAEGKTIIFVSHDLASIKEFSDRVLLLNKGRTYGVFSASKAIALYSQINQERAEKQLARTDNAAEHLSRGDLPSVKTVSLLGKSGQKTHTINRDEPMRVRLKIANPSVLPIAVGIAIYRVADGFYCFGTNTRVDKIKLNPKQTMSVELTYPDLPLQKGVYDLTVGVFDKEAREVYEMTEHVLNFQVVQPDDTEGITWIKHSWRQTGDK